jgi:hypothetical protein
MLPLRRSLVAAVAALVAPLLLSAAAVQQIPGLQWERRLAADAGLRAHAAAFSPADRTVLIAGVSLPKDGSAGGPSFWMWRVNQTGEQVQAVTVRQLPPGTKLNEAYPYVRAIAALENGDALLAVEFVEQRPSVLRIDRAGRTVWSQEIATQASDAALSRILPLQDRSFLLLGRAGPHALVVKMDASGAVLWQQEYERSEPATFSDGVATVSGALLVGSSGAYYQPVGPSQVWLARIGPDGKIESQRAFAGRQPRLSPDPEGGAAVVYASSNLLDSRQPSWIEEVWVQAVDGALQEKWKTRAFSFERGMGSAGFALASLPGGDFVVAGSRLDRLFVARLGRDGRIAWQFGGRDPARFEDLVAGNGDLFVLSSAGADTREAAPGGVRLTRFVQSR